MVWYQHNCNILHIRAGGEDEGTHLAKVRRNVGYLSYPREEESRGRRHTSHRPGAHVSSRHGETSGGDCGRDHEEGTTQGRLPFLDPRDPPAFPPLSGSTRRQLSARELRDARPPAPKLVDRLRAAQLEMRAGRRCHPLKTVRAGNFNEPCCSFLPARGAVLVVPCGSRQQI